VIGIWVNSYSLVDISDPTGLLFCRGYGIVIPDVYLLIAISRSKGVHELMVIKSKIFSPKNCYNELIQLNEW
jgi:hypothetical protein